MSHLDLIKEISKMTLDQLALSSAKREIRKRLSNSFTEQQREDLISAFSWITEELDKYNELKAQIKAMQRHDAIAAIKQRRMKARGLKDLRLPKPGA